MTVVLDSPRAPEDLEDRIERYVIFPDGSGQDPYADYDELRVISPVYRMRSGAWLVTGYKEYGQLARDRRISRAEAAKNEMGDVSSLPEELHPALNAFAGMLINQDDPGHARLRKLVRHAFLPANARGWLPRTRQIAEEVVDAVMGRSSFDFLEEVGYPLPETVMTELIGVPHRERHLWADWSRQITSYSRTMGGRSPDVDRVRRAMKLLYDYMAQLVDERRASGDYDGEDMLAVLLRADEEGDRLSRDELIGSMIMLAQASHETTANASTNAMYHLLRRPHLMKQLHDDPELIPVAIDEFLRFESSSHSLLPRVATEDIEIADTIIPAGERIVLLTAAANRDPAVFSDPHEIRFDRPASERHTAFGGGPHSCLGQNLARIELTAMFEQMTGRLAHVELKEPAQFATGRARGLERLIVGPPA